MAKNKNGAEASSADQAGTLAKASDNIFNNFAIMKMAGAGSGELASAADLSEALKENLGGQQLSAFDFDRIRVPAGGGLAWEIPNKDTGELEAATEVIGVICSWNDQKAFWNRGLDEAGAVAGPPNCFSRDCIKGIGDPGIACAACPNNQFGSAKGGAGRGKACKDVRMLFIIREGDIIPILIPVPPTSLKPIKKYFMNLAARAIPYWRAVTRLTLSADKNSSGIKYAKVTPALVATIEGDAVPVFRSYGNTIKQLLGNATIPLMPADLRGNGGDADEPETSGSAAPQVSAAGQESDRVAAV